MEIKNFTLIELLQSRSWLVLVMNSTRMFTEISNEQMTKARQRLSEIEKELVSRIIDGNNYIKTFCDENFEETLQQLKEEK